MCHSEVVESIAIITTVVEKNRAPLDSTSSTAAAAATAAALSTQQLLRTISTASLSLVAPHSRVRVARTYHAPHVQSRKQLLRSLIRSDNGRGFWGYGPRKRDSAIVLNLVAVAVVVGNEKTQNGVVSVAISRTRYEMRAICSRFAVDFSRAVCGAAATASPARTFASSPDDGGKPRQPRVDALSAVKPHARAGVLSAVRGDDSGFPSYLILKETSPLLRLVWCVVLRRPASDGGETKSANRVLYPERKLI